MLFSANLLIFYFIPRKFWQKFHVINWGRNFLNNLKVSSRPEGLFITYNWAIINIIVTWRMVRLHGYNASAYKPIKWARTAYSTCDRNCSCSSLFMEKINLSNLVLWRKLVIKTISHLPFMKTILLRPYKQHLIIVWN